MPDSFCLTTEQQFLKETASQFAIEHIKPNAQTWDKNYEFPRTTYKLAAELGFSGLSVSEDNGGLGLGAIDCIILYSELARACPSTAAYLSIHNMVCRVLDKYGNEYHKALLPDLIAMNTFASYCLSEPNAGSDAAALSTKAKLSGDQYILNGSKAFISGGGNSDVYLIMARTSDDGAKGISCFVVEKDTPGLSFGKQEKKLGWHSQPTAMIHLEDCKIPKKNLVAQAGEGFNIALSALSSGRLNIAACSLGGAKECLSMTKNYLEERQQFNISLSKMHTLRALFAGLATRLEASQALLFSAAYAVQYALDFATIKVAMAKQFVTDECFDICNQSLQLHGGYGYLNDYPLERYIRDLRAHQIVEGTNDIMRLIIARGTLDEAWDF